MNLFCITSLLAVAPAVLSAILAPPLVAYDVQYVDIPTKRHLELEVFENLEERIPTIHLGTYSLAKIFPKVDILVQIKLGTSNPLNSFGDTAGLSLTLTATCQGCYITGNAVVTTTGVKKDESILGDIISFLKDPTEVVINALDLNLEVSLENFGGHFELDITFAAAGTYTVMLYKSESPVGVELDDHDKVGLLLTLELILTVTAQVDFTAGFDIVFPPGTNFVLNPLSGEIVSMNIGGAQVEALPLKFTKGSACVTAVLRLKFQAGISLEVLGKGFDFEAGVYFDPIQYKACVAYQPGQACQVEFTEFFYEEIAAYARAVGDLDFAKWSAGPTAVTTFHTGTLPSKCFRTSESKPTPHSTTATKTTPPPIKQESEPPIKHSTASVPSHTASRSKSLTSEKSASKSSNTSPLESGPTSSVTAPHKSSSRTSETSSTATLRSSGPKSSKIPTGTHNSTVSVVPSTTSGKRTESYSSSSTGKHTTSSGTKGAATGSSSSVSSEISVSKDLSTVSTSSAGGKNHLHTGSTSSAPYGNYSTSTQSASKTTTWLSSTASLSTTSVSSNVGLASSLSESNLSTYTQSTSSQNSGSSIESSSGVQISSTYTSPAPDSNTYSDSTFTSPIDISSTPAPIDTSLTTQTIYATLTYTITSCLSLLEWCPDDLQTDVLQTKTIFQYTTVCPVTQTLSAFAAPAAASTMEVVPATASVTQVIVVTSPVPLTPCETPIISTFTGFPTYYTQNYRPNITVTAPYPTFNFTSSNAFPTGTASSRSSYPTSSSSRSKSSGILTAGVETPTSHPGLAPVIYSVGGYPTPKPEIKAQGTPLAVSATPSFTKVSVGNSLSASRVSCAIVVVFAFILVLGF